MTNQIIITITDRHVKNLRVDENKGHVYYDDTAWGKKSWCEIQNIHKYMKVEYSIVKKIETDEQD